MKLHQLSLIPRVVAQIYCFIHPLPLNGLLMSTFPLKRLGLLPGARGLNLSFTFPTKWKSCVKQYPPIM